MSRRGNAFPVGRAPDGSRSLLVRASLAVLAVALAPALALAGQAARVPAEPMSYLGSGWLERAERDDEERPDVVLEHLDLRPGMVVADVGTGTGFYARRFAAEVGPDGTVYAIDIQPEMLELLEQRLAQEGVEGVVPVLSTPDNPSLPGPVDLVFLADVYHEIADPLPVQRRLHEALNDGGRVVLLEYRAEDATGDHIKSDHRMSVRQVVKEWRQAGFDLVDLHTDLPTQHMIVLARVGDPVFAKAGAEHRDLVEARTSDAISLEARGESDATVRVRARNQTGGPIVLTAPAGTRFVAAGRKVEMLARRDMLLVVPAAGSAEVLVGAVPRRWDREAPGANDELDILVVADGDPEARILAAVQAGTYEPVPTAPRAYVPQTPEVAKAAVWMVLEDASWPDVRDDLEQPRFPAEYAAAFGLVLATEAGQDVSRRPAWRLRGEIFSGLQLTELQQWYRSRR